MNDNKITLESFRGEIEKLKKLKDFKDEKEKEFETADTEYEMQRTLVLSFLQEHELDKFSVPGIANVSVAHKFYVAYPQSQEDIKKFHDYLDSSGRGHERKMHSSTLTSMIRTMVDEAKEKQEVVELPPGIGAPTIKLELRVLKG